MAHTPFLQNCWYVAGWADEVAPGNAITRKIADMDILIWRDGQASLVAVVNRCPHRMAPLHLGKIEGGRITCGYHGLEFDGTGRCVKNPHGAISSALAIRAFPIAERHGAIWVWLGEPSLADTKQISDLSFIDRFPETSYTKGVLRVAAGHQLLEDNILDLSHADYLHPDTLGGGAITRSRPSIDKRQDNSVFVSWRVVDDAPLPIVRADVGTDKVDMWVEVLWYPNGVMVLSVATTPHGLSREEGVETISCHIMTPETHASTHYFYLTARNFRMEDAEYNVRRGAALRQAFELEDKPMIEAQQAVIGERDLFDYKPALFPSDAGSVTARRIFSELVRAEAD